MKLKKLILIFSIINLLSKIEVISCMNQETINIEESYSNTIEDINETETQILSKNIKNLEKLFTLNDYGIEIYKKNCKNKIFTIKIKNNFLLIKFLNFKKHLTDLRDKKTIFKNEKNLKLSKDGKLLFIALKHPQSKLIDLESYKTIINFENPRANFVIFSNNNKYLLALYGSTSYQLAYLVDIQNKKEIMRFRDIIEAKFTKNSDFLSVKHSFYSQIINLKTLKLFGCFCGEATLSNTGKFLYGKVRSTIFSLLNMADPLFMNKMDKSRPHIPKLVNLKNMKILQKFNNWGHPTFSNNDCFFCIYETNHSNNNVYTNETKLIDLETNKTIKQFNSESKNIIIKFDTQNQFAIVCTKNLSQKNENLSELIDTKTADNIMYFKNISLWNSKFSNDNKFLKLQFKNDSKEIINIKEKATILKFDENENCGLTDNFIWMQDENNILRIIKLSSEIKLFKKNLLNKYKQANTSHNTTKKSFFSDVNIITQK